MEYKLSGFISIFSIEWLFCQLNIVVLLLDLFCTHTTLYFIIYPIYDLNNMQSPGRREFLKWISLVSIETDISVKWWRSISPKLILFLQKSMFWLCCIINTFLLFLRNTQLSKKNICGIERIHTYTSDEAMNSRATRIIKWSEEASPVASG